MVTFGKSKENPNYYYVDNGRSVIYYHKREMEELKGALDAAIDDKGNISSFVQLRRHGGVGLFNGRGNYGELSRLETGELITQIEDRLLKEALIEDRIKRMGR